MTSDLLAKSGRLERIPLQDADLFYLPRLALPLPDTDALDRLAADVPWRCEEITLWGRTLPQPRLTAWYGDPGKRYAYSGIELAPLPWTALLRDVKACVEEAAGARFNSVLVNYYRDNQDSVGFHSDNEPELGEQPHIASLSLGAERSFILKHKTRKILPVHLRLASGSLLIMRGDTQRCWKHAVPKETRHCAPRINLTFRQIIG